MMFAAHPDDESLACTVAPRRDVIEARPLAIR